MFLILWLLSWNSIGLASPQLKSDPKKCETVVSNLLQRKKEALDRRERTIKVREVDIKTAEKRIETKLKGMEAMRLELRSLMKEMDDQQQVEINRMVAMFERMRPKQAAGVVENIADQNIAAAVLRGMSEAKAGKILGSMSPQKAAKLTELITQHPRDRR